MEKFAILARVEAKAGKEEEVLAFFQNQHCHLRSENQKRSGGMPSNWVRRLLGFLIRLKQHRGVQLI